MPEGVRALGRVVVDDAIDQRPAVGPAATRRPEDAEPEPHRADHSSDESGDETADGAAPASGKRVRVVARRRRPQRVPRPHAVFLRLSDEEYEVLALSAAAAGSSLAAFVATQAVAVARGLLHPVPSSVVEVVRELVAARTQLTRYGVLLNQAVARLHVVGEVDAGLVRAAERCDAAAAALRAASERLGAGT